MARIESLYVQLIARSPKKDTMTEAGLRVFRIGEGRISRVPVSLCPPCPHVSMGVPGVPVGDRKGARHTSIKSRSARLSARPPQSLDCWRIIQPRAAFLGSIGLPPITADKIACGNFVAFRVPANHNVPPVTPSVSARHVSPPSNTHKTFSLIYIIGFCGRKKSPLSSKIFCGVSGSKLGA